MSKAAELAALIGSQSSLSNRNLIINGGCVIDQRNNGSSISGTGLHVVDRWQHFESQSSKFTSIQRSTDAPANFINSVEYTSASSYSVLASDFFSHEQAIEGYTAAHLGWGTANAKDVTLSFWVKSSLTGTFGGALYSGTGSYGYAFSYTISSANTWEQKSVTITAPTSGTFATDNTKSFNVCFSLGQGSDYKFAAGSWQSQVVRSVTGETSLVGTSGATWYITGVQLEVGEQATPFEHRSYADELARCQRYFEGGAYANASATGQAGLIWTWRNDGTDRAFPYMNGEFKVVKRATPTITIQSGQDGTGNRLSGYSSGTNYTVSSIQSPSRYYVCSYFQTTGGLPTQSLAGYYTADAEL